ncbi:MAG: hypothetical protein ABIR36_00355 [Nitrospiraceae bacterium]
MPDRAMSEEQDMQQRVLEQNSQRGFSCGILFVIQWTVGTVLVVLMGSWLVWWTIHLQRQFAEDEIRAACQRVMPDTVQRCVDTVVIQRGGARR